VYGRSVDAKRRRARRPAVTDRCFVIHHVIHHLTLPLILIVLTRSDRGIQSATEMLRLKDGRDVAHSFNCTPRLSIMRLVDTLVFVAMVALLPWDSESWYCFPRVCLSVSTNQNVVLETYLVV